MAGKHTAGPWVTCDAHGPLAGGMSVMSAHDNYMIASTTGYYGRGGAQANARLIAAAPDLLAALIGLRALYDTDEGCRSTPEYLAASAAIARATQPIPPQSEE